MALNPTGTRVIGSAASDAKAAGYAIPIVTPLTDTIATVKQTIQIAKSAVEDADEAITWANLYTEFGIVEVALIGFFDGTTNTVNSYGEVSKVTLVDDPKYGNVAPYYEFEYVLRAQVVVP